MENQPVNQSMHEGTHISTILNENAENNMKRIVADVNTKLNNTNINIDTANTENETDTDDKDTGILHSIPNYIKEIVILLVVYLILSQPYIKNMIGSVLPQINTNMSGNISFSGYVIYGLILAILYVIIKKMLLQ